MRGGFSRVRDYVVTMRLSVVVFTNFFLIRTMIFAGFKISGDILFFERT